MFTKDEISFSSRGRRLFPTGFCARAHTTTTIRVSVWIAPELLYKLPTSDAMQNLQGGNMCVALVH